MPSKTKAKIEVTISDLDEVERHLRRLSYLEKFIRDQIAHKRSAAAILYGVSNDTSERLRHEADQMEEALKYDGKECSPLASGAENNRR